MCPPDPNGPRLARPGTGRNRSRCDPRFLMWAAERQGGTQMSGGTSIFEYMYRDGGNFKTFGQLRLTGWDEQADARIRLCLEVDGQFVAEQIGVPSLCMEHWQAVEDGPSDLDHAFHEFVCLRQ